MSAQSEIADFYATLDSLYISKHRELQPGEFTMGMECQRTGRTISMVTRMLQEAVAKGLIESEVVVLHGKRTKVYKPK